MDRFDYTGSSKTDFRTGKTYSPSVWSCCKNILGFCEGGIGIEEGVICTGYGTNLNQDGSVYELNIHT